MIMPSMLKKIILFLSIPPLTLLAAALFIELGYNLRQKLDTPSNMSVPSAQNILFIGDSILGFLNDPQSLATQIKNQLDQKKPQTFQFSEISRPALRSSEVIALLSRYLKNNPSPNAVILMAGKSDYIHPSIPAFRFLSRFRLFRLLEFGYWDIQKKLFAWQKRRSAELAQKAQPAWDFWGQGNCKEAIPHFEKVISQGYQFSRPIRALLSCYIAEKKFMEGTDFLRKIKPISTEKTLVEKSIEILQQYPDNAQRLKTHFSPPKVDVESRTDLRFQMWVSMVQNHPETMFNIYKNANEKTSDRIHSYTRNNLVEIINLLSHTKAQIIILQYPLDHLSVLSEVLPPTSSRMQLIDVRSLLLQAPPHEFSSFWQEDIEHLSAHGNAWLAEKVAPSIVGDRKDLYDSL
jgi:hypothetical protein